MRAAFGAHRPPCRARRRRISKRAANNRASGCTVRRICARSRAPECRKLICSGSLGTAYSATRSRPWRPAIRRCVSASIAAQRRRPVRRRPAVARLRTRTRTGLVVDGTPGHGRGDRGDEHLRVDRRRGLVRGERPPRAPRTGRTARRSSRPSTAPGVGIGPILGHHLRDHLPKRLDVDVAVGVDGDPVLVVRAPAPRGNHRSKARSKVSRCMCVDSRVAAKASRTDSRSSRSRTPSAAPASSSAAGPMSIPACATHRRIRRGAR